MSTGNPKYWYNMYAWCGLELLEKIVDIKKRKRLYEIIRGIEKKCAKKEKQT